MFIDPYIFPSFKCALVCIFNITTIQIYKQTYLYGSSKIAENFSFIQIAMHFVYHINERASVRVHILTTTTKYA